jgi:DNA polymerase IV
MNAPRRVAHLDMDAFYASVELLRRPELKGKPIAIGGRGDPNSRAVVTTATYEARQFGVRSGISLYKARQLCSDLIMLPVNFDLYRQYSRKFKAAVLEVCPVMEDRGIDEVYLELSGISGSAESIAADLQASVFNATGLTCSIGVAPNKLLAKICSDLNKPNGVTVLRADEIEARIWPLPVKRINGVGPKANETLASYGVQTIGELAAVAPHLLTKRFGRSYGEWLHESAHGRDDRPVEVESETVSVSRETTLQVNLHLKRQREAVNEVLEDLTQSLSRDLQRKQLMAGQVGVKVKFEDFTGVTRDFSMRESTQDAKVLFAAALLCLDRVPSEKPIRLVGIKAGSLTPCEDVPPANFDLFT